MGHYFLDILYISPLPSHICMMPLSFLRGGELMNYREIREKVAMKKDFKN